MARGARGVRAAGGTLWVLAGAGVLGCTPLLDLGGYEYSDAVGSGGGGGAAGGGAGPSGGGGSGAGGTGGGGEGGEAPVPCAGSSNAPFVDPGDLVGGTIEAGDASPQYYQYANSGNYVLWLEVEVDTPTPSAMGDTLTVRICDPDGNVVAWASGSPAGLYEDIGEVRVSARLNVPGAWGIEVVPPDARGWSYEINASDGFAVDNTTTMSMPSNVFLNQGEVLSSVATLHFPGKTNWFRINTPCASCTLRIVSGQAYPASLAVGKADVYDDADVLLTSVVDPAPDDDSDFLHHDQPITSAAPILVGITDANGNGDYDTWVPWYATVIAAQ